MGVTGLHRKLRCGWKKRRRVCHISSKVSDELRIFTFWKKSSNGASKMLGSVFENTRPEAPMLVFRKLYAYNS